MTARTFVGHQRGHRLATSEDNNLAIDRVRTWPIRRFPYLIFYVEADSGIDVWRLLHSTDLQTDLAEE